MYPFAVIAAIYEPLTPEMQSDFGLACACWTLSQLYQKGVEDEAINEQAPSLLK
jgi:hypothetical protein